MDIMYKITIHVLVCTTNFVCSRAKLLLSSISLIKDYLFKNGNLDTFSFLHYSCNSLLFCEQIAVLATLRGV